ncbi:MAG: LarC family nickel insertion protein [Chloroflexi bacterium]|nr:LarC family nickel insertion protein [Chloroflexota bacterium]
MVRQAHHERDRKTMTRIAYLDCFSGVSGDMLLGGLLDAGLSADALRGELAKLHIGGYEVRSERVLRAGLAATQAVVTVAEPQPERALPDILSIIERSSVPKEDREKGASVFRRLAAAEAKAHGVSVEEVRLHDVGAVDAVVDVMGTVAGLRLLGVAELFASALPAGGGEAKGPHGSLPVPAPATLELLAQAKAPLAPGNDLASELVTPTGAAIVTTLARFERPAMTVEGVGYGAGARDIEGWPPAAGGEDGPAPGPGLPHRAGGGGGEAQGLARSPARACASSTSPR